MPGAADRTPTPAHVGRRPSEPAVRRAGLRPPGLLSRPPAAGREEALRQVGTVGSGDINLQSATWLYVSALLAHRRVMPETCGRNDYEAIRQAANYLADAAARLRDAIPDACLGFYAIGPHRVGRADSLFGVKKIVKPFNLREVILE